MCGIFCCISSEIGYGQEIFQNLQDILSRRGPDQHNQVEREVGNFRLLFGSWVLHMRGLNLISQPAQSRLENILLWNGEMYNESQASEDISDTSVLLEQLDSYVTCEEVGRAISRIEGPWALVYYQKSTKRLWFGRDYFGRRSLLISHSTHGLILSSVAKRTSMLEWVEVPPGIFCFDLDRAQADTFHVLKLFPWISITNKEPKIPKANLLNLSLELISGLNPPITRHCTNSIIRPITALTESEGLLGPLDLLVNSCEQKSLWPICESLIVKLRGAVKRRIQTTSTCGTPCSVGILFSGGIDCTVLALLAHSFVAEDEPIELLNVAFSGASKNNKVKNRVSEADYNVPDRMTGRSSYEELCNLCPSRHWRLVEINVTVEELQQERSSRIANLTHPKTTVLDDSIACALWFACRGEGLIKQADEQTTVYKAKSRILLCGMGADEQLGGYSRHRGIYEKNRRWSDVTAEINMEVERIATRNLGRDDRIIADHSREALFPYLDEEVAGFLTSVETHLKADFRLERGVGEKILLRGAAYCLGLRKAAVLPKRAIQFGSRIAKAEARSEKGNDICVRLQGI